MADPIHSFYCNKSYLDLSHLLKIKSNGYCAHCKHIFDYSLLRTHHIIELNIDNIHDVEIALNPSNLEVICHDCHNKVHRRFGNTPNKKVYLVWGAPLAGKTSYVAQTATRYDLVVDLDKIHKAITVCAEYDKPDATKRIAWDIRDLLLDKIKVRNGDWECAYIIGTYPDKRQRDRFVNDYGAELIHIVTTQDECIKRAHLSDERFAVKEQTITYINNYFHSLRL